MPKNVKIGIERLENLVSWSDRLGTDEKFEIEEIIKILKNDSK
jgi:hypothetical protein